jgi:hypothetical protein
MTSRKKPGMAFWATVTLVVVLVGYPLSFGPACWLVEKGSLSESQLTSIYEPCIQLSESGPEYVKLALTHWVDACGGEWALTDINARRSFELAPDLNVTSLGPGTE